MVWMTKQASSARFVSRATVLAGACCAALSAGVGAQPVMVAPVPIVPCSVPGTLVAVSTSNSSLEAVSDNGQWAVGVSVLPTGMRQIILWHVPTRTLINLGRLPGGVNPAPGGLSVSDGFFVVATDGNSTFVWNGPVGAPFVDASTILSPAFNTIALSKVTHNNTFFAGNGVDPTLTNVSLGVDLLGATVSPNPAFAAGNVGIADATEIDHLRFPGANGAKFVLLNNGSTPPSAWISLNGSPVVARMDTLPGQLANGFCISADGTVVGGVVASTTGGSIFNAAVWTFGTLRQLPPLPGDFFAEMRGLNGDGRWGVGTSWGGTSRRGFLFDSTNAAPTPTRRLLTALRQEFCTPISGWSELEPLDMSSNGTIVGIGTRTNGTRQAFAATIPLPNYCYADFDKNGVVDTADSQELLNWFAGIPGAFYGPFAIDVNFGDVDRDSIIDPFLDTQAFLQLIANGC
jgi:uncharacterized membrane protein